MYEQFLYFWFSWIIFIIVYFFMRESKLRSFLIAWILLTITCTNVSFTINNTSISLPFLLLLGGGIIFYALDRLTIYKWITTFSIMLGYVALLIWEKITPIWFFMPSYFIIPILSVLIITLLIRSRYEQLAVGILGISFGQLLYEITLISYRLNNTVGEKAFFIHLQVMILFLIFMQFAQTCFNKLSAFLKRNLA